MGEKNLVQCKPGTVGEVVMIQMFGSKVKLRLCEVQVIGIPGKSSLYSDFIGVVVILINKLLFKRQYYFLEERIPSDVIKTAQKLL